MFKQAFEFHFGDIMDWTRMKSLLTLSNKTGSTVLNLKLSDLVSLTDFIGISEACSLFEIDSLKHCDAAVRQENARNYEFEFR